MFRYIMQIVIIEFELFNNHKQRHLILKYVQCDFLSMPNAHPIFDQAKC